MGFGKALGLIGAGFSGVAAYDLLQRKHAILRNYPVVGHLRYLLEEIRPEIQQYFIERNWDGRPYDRDTRSIIYERAKATMTEQPFGAASTNAARAMMMATGCIQAQLCHTGKCPVGVATQDPRRARALDVADKSVRVRNYQDATVAEAVKIMAAMGASSPRDLRTDQLRHNVSTSTSATYAELYDWLSPGELLAAPPPPWAADWAAASPDTFHPRGQ